MQQVSCELWWWFITLVFLKSWLCTQILNHLNYNSDIAIIKIMPIIEGATTAGNQLKQ